MQQRRQALLAELGRAFWRLPALRLAAVGEAPGRSLPAALARGLHLVAGSLAHLELEAPQLATLDWVASAHAATARCCPALPRCAVLSRESSCRRSCANCKPVQALLLGKSWQGSKRLRLASITKNLALDVSTVLLSRLVLVYFGQAGAHHVGRRAAPDMPEPARLHCAGG